MASGHMNRVKRPDTWLHRPMLQNVKKVLANPEPSTHDPRNWRRGVRYRTDVAPCDWFGHYARLALLTEF